MIRKLHADHEQTQHPHYLGEIENLRKRVNLIRDMQTVGTGSLLCCTLSMALLFFGWTVAAQVMFSVSLVLMAASLTISILEIRMSVGALDLHLADLKSARDQISKSDPSSSYDSNAG